MSRGVSSDNTVPGRKTAAVGTVSCGGEKPFTVSDAVAGERTADVADDADEGRTIRVIRVIRVIRGFSAEAS